MWPHSLRYTSHPTHHQCRASAEHPCLFLPGMHADRSHLPKGKAGGAETSDHISWILQNREFLHYYPHIRLTKVYLPARCLGQDRQFQDLGKSSVPVKVQSLVLLKICLSSRGNPLDLHAQPLFVFLQLMKALGKQVISLKITNRFQTIKTRALGEQFSHPSKKHVEILKKKISKKN